LTCRRRRYTAQCTDHGPPCAHARLRINSPGARYAEDRSGAGDPRAYDAPRTSTPDTLMNENVTPAPFDAEQLAELREDFDHFDRNKDGRMELGEFVHFLQTLE